MKIVDSNLKIVSHDGLIRETLGLNRKYISSAVKYGRNLWHSIDGLHNTECKTYEWGMEHQVEKGEVPILVERIKTYPALFSEKKQDLWVRSMDINVL